MKTKTSNKLSKPKLNPTMLKTDVDTIKRRTRSVNRGTESFEKDQWRQIRRTPSGNSPGRAASRKLFGLCLRISDVGERPSGFPRPRRLQDRPPFEGGASRAFHRICAASP